MKLVNVSFTSNGYDIRAKGIVTSECNVEELDIKFKSLEDGEWPDRLTMELIEEEAMSLMIDKVYTPELSFD